MLLGFPLASGADVREKVVVMNVAGAQVGLVADQARAIVSADPSLVDPLPPALASRMGGESRIRAIYRGEEGRRLISILAPEQLFREDVMQRLSAQRDRQDTPTAPAERARGNELNFLVFRLRDDEFALADRLPSRRSRRFLRKSRACPKRRSSWKASSICAAPSCR